MELSELMGHAPAKVDAKGRIKIPTAFRSIIEERYGSECFITSFEGDKALLYPIPVWREFNARLAKVPSTSPSKRKLMERVHYYGQTSTIDGQGRVLLPAVLRDRAGLDGEVVVLGSSDHLIVWSQAAIDQRMSEDPLTDEDYRELELHGV